jgi:undecaprenyl-diphosphatase
MDLLPIRRHRGIRQIGEGLGTLDREVFDAIAESLRFGDSGTRDDGK